MGIVTIVGALLMVIIVNSVGLFTTQSSKLEQGLNINDTLTEVRSSIKDASSIASVYTGGSTTYTTGATQLVLNLPSINISNNIISGSFDTYIYFLDTNRIRLKTFPDAQSSRKPQDQIFSNIIDSLKFQYFNSATPPVEVTPVSATKIRISLTLKQKKGTSYEINTATSEANLRND